MYTFNIHVSMIDYIIIILWLVALPIELLLLYMFKTISLKIYIIFIIFTYTIENYIYTKFQMFNYLICSLFL